MAHRPRLRAGDCRHPGRSHGPQTAGPAQPRPEFAFSFGPLIIVTSRASSSGRDDGDCPELPVAAPDHTTLDTARLGVLFPSCGACAADRAGPRWRRSSASKSSWASPGSSRVSRTDRARGARRPRSVRSRNKQHWMAITVAIVGVSVLKRCGWASAPTIVGVHRSRSLPNSRSHAQSATSPCVLQERPERFAGHGRQTGRSDVDHLLPGAGGRAGAERPAVYPWRHPQGRADAHRHAAGVLSGQAGAHVGQRQGPEVLQRARRRSRVGHDDCVRLCRRSLHRFRRAADVPPGLRVRALHRRDVRLVQVDCLAPRDLRRLRHRGVLAVGLSLRALVGDDARRHGGVHGVSRPADRAARSLPAGPLRERAAAEGAEIMFETPLNEDRTTSLVPGPWSLVRPALGPSRSLVPGPFAGAS